VIYEKIISRRTIRRYQRKPVPEEVLVRCVDAARLSPSSANRQPLKYLIINDERLLKDVFGTLGWAGYLLPQLKPTEEVMPQAYIVMLLDKNISQKADYDAGIASMSISAVAHDEGLGSCILASIDRDRLRKILKIPEGLEILLVVSLGYPAETSLVEKMREDDVKYWLDEKRVLHVPKRDLQEITKWNRY